MTERPDRGHVKGAEWPVRLHQHGHLAAVAVGPVGNPAEMQDPVHGPVGDLRGKLVAEQVERREGEPVEVRAGRGSLMHFAPRRPIPYPTLWYRPYGTVR